MKELVAFDKAEAIRLYSAANAVIRCCESLRLKIDRLKEQRKIIVAEYGEAETAFVQYVGGDDAAIEFGESIDNERIES